MQSRIPTDESLPQELALPIEDPAGAEARTRPAGPLLILG